jgi:hypothetical protein
MKDDTPQRYTSKFKLKPPVLGDVLLTTLEHNYNAIGWISLKLLRQAKSKYKGLIHFCPFFIEVVIA